MTRRTFNTTDKAVMVLMFRKGKSTREIADQLGVNIRSVHTIVTRRGAVPTERRNKQTYICPSCLTKKQEELVKVLILRTPLTYMELPRTMGDSIKEETIRRYVDSIPSLKRNRTKIYN